MHLRCSYHVKMDTEAKPCTDAFVLNGCGNCIIDIGDVNTLACFPASTLSALILRVYDRSESQNRIIEILKSRLQCNGNISIVIGTPTDNIDCSKVNILSCMTLLVTWVTVHNNSDFVEDCKIIGRYTDDLESAHSMETCINLITGMNFELEMLSRRKQFELEVSAQR